MIKDPILSAKYHRREAAILKNIGTKRSLREAALEEKTAEKYERQLPKRQLDLFN